MSIKELIKFIGVKNIAEDLDEDTLMTLGSDVRDRFEQDQGSMKDWATAVDFGLALVKQELHPKSTPWEGAANFKSPILTEASLAFGNRASLELLRTKNLVRTDVIGLKTQSQSIARQSQAIDEAKQAVDQQQQAMEQLKEGGGQPKPQTVQQVQGLEQQISEQTQDLEQRQDGMRDKTERADRITEVMNYQINHEMTEWRKQHKRLLYTLPSVGSMFKKTIFDPLLGRNISHIIHYPNFAVNQATTEIETARSFTHILDISQNELVEKQRADIWLDIDLYPEESEGDEGSNEKEEVTDATDNPNRFLEQYCFADLDEDGYEEPYIITVHEMTRKVVRIVARFDDRSIVVSDKNGVVEPLIDNMKRQIDDIVQQAQQTGTPPSIPDDPDLTGLSLVRIDASQQITQYGFIPSSDGTFLDVGYFHLIGAITMGVNTTTNQLIDAATLANRQSGFTAKGFRKKMGPISLRPGEFKSTEVPAGQMQNSIMLAPIKEPSQTLFALNEKLDGQGRQFAASVDASGQITAQTAPTTALAVIQEQLIPLSALMGRIIDAMSEEFQKLFVLNQKFLDPEQYQEILDDPQADFNADFNSDGFDIVPTANAEMSSKMQRIQMAEVQMSMFDRVLQAQGNPIPLVRNFFESIGSDLTDEIFPDEQRMSAEDRQRLDALKQQTEQQNQLLQQQNRIGELQVELLGRAEDRKDDELQVKSLKTMTEIDKINREMTKLSAEIILTLEKAESEDVKNQVNIYTAKIEEQQQLLQAARGT